MAGAGATFGSAGFLTGSAALGFGAGSVFFATTGADFGFEWGGIGLGAATVFLTGATATFGATFLAAVFTGNAFTGAFFTGADAAFTDVLVGTLVFSVFEAAAVLAVILGATVFFGAALLVLLLLSIIVFLIGEVFFAGTGTFLAAGFDFGVNTFTGFIAFFTATALGADATFLESAILLFATFVGLAAWTFFVTMII